jgi:hypothetical protein
MSRLLSRRHHCARGAEKGVMGGVLVTVDSKRLVRAAFGATIFVFAVGTPLSWWQGHEPYPALVMPAFPLYKGTVVRTEATCTVRFADGHAAPISFYDLLPPTPVEPTSIISASFKDGEWTTDPERRAWLFARVAERFPDQRPTGMDITWQMTTYSAAPPQHRPIKTVHVDFR